MGLFIVRIKRQHIKNNVVWALIQHQNYDQKLIVISTLASILRDFTNDKTLVYIDISII